MANILGIKDKKKIHVNAAAVSATREAFSCTLLLWQCSRTVCVSYLIVAGGSEGCLVQQAARGGQREKADT